MVAPGVLYDFLQQPVIQFMIRICEAQAASANKIPKYTQTEKQLEIQEKIYTEKQIDLLILYCDIVTVNCWKISAT